jgi:hypothetical protein
MTLAAEVASAGELAGVWTLTIETPRGVQHPVLTIREDGGNWSGIYEGRIGTHPVAITRDGDRFTFPLEATMPMGTVTLEYAGSIDGDTMTGVARNPMGEVPFTGTRTKP